MQEDSLGLAIGSHIDALRNDPKEWDVCLQRAKVGTARMFFSSLYHCSTPLRGLKFSVKFFTFLRLGRSLVDVNTKDRYGKADHEKDAFFALKDESNVKSLY